jgi:hypothetical protein
LKNHVRISSSLRLLFFLIAVISSAIVSAVETPEKPTSPAPAKDVNSESTWYAMALGQLAGRPVVGHFWSKGFKLRAETVIFGRPILTLVDTKYYYTIDVLNGTGLAIQRSPVSIAEDASRTRPFATEWDEMSEAGGEKVRSEKIGSQETEVWRLTNVSGRRTIWVSTEVPRLVMRVETYDRDSSETERVEYVNWQYGLAIPDSFFQPGPEIRIRRMEYGKYVAAARKGPVGPAPPLYRYLLHGRKKPSQ